MMALCAAAAFVLGCKSAPEEQKADAKSEAQCREPQEAAKTSGPQTPTCPGAPKKACDGSAERTKKGSTCPKESAGHVASRKMKALAASTKTNDLRKVRAAAEELATAMAKHKAHGKMAKKPSYKQKAAACHAAIKAAVEARTSMDATDAVKAIGPTCGDCHTEFKM